MILRRVYPDPVESFELDAENTRDRLLQLYQLPAARWTRLNMVTSVSGSAAGVDGTSGSLTSKTDRRILGVIRELGDVVLVGAASVRAEGYQLPRRSRLAILTSSGDLSGHRLEAESTGEILVLCPQSAVDAVEASLPGAQLLVVSAESHRIALPAALAALRDLGLNSIVCEGGPALASQLLAAGLIDELCLTTSPQLGGTALPLLSDDVPLRTLALRQSIIDDAGFVFARWSIESS